MLSNNVASIAYSLLVVCRFRSKPINSECQNRRELQQIKLQQIKFIPSVRSSMSSINCSQQEITYYNELI